PPPTSLPLTFTHRRSAKKDAAGSFALLLREHEPQRNRPNSRRNRIPRLPNSRRSHAPLARVSVGHRGGRSGLDKPRAACYIGEKVRLFRKSTFRLQLG